jgi:hypothetical protein
LLEDRSTPFNNEEILLTKFIVIEVALVVKNILVFVMIHVFPAYFDTLTKVRLRWGLGIWDWITFGIALCIDLHIEYLSLPRVKGVAKLME